MLLLKASLTQSNYIEINVHSRQVTTLCKHNPNYSLPYNRLVKLRYRITDQCLEYHMEAIAGG